MNTCASLVFIGSLLGVLSLAGCHASGVSEPLAAESTSHTEPTHDPHLVPCTCAASVPSLGTMCITSHLRWFEGYLDRSDPAKARKFWRAALATADGRKVTLIAGAISTIEESDVNLRGIVPPGVSGFAPGLTVEHCDGGPGIAGCDTELCTLLGGFIHVQVSPATHFTSRFWAPWPFIVRTKAIPAGAYSSEFVLLSIPSGGSGGPLREVIYRPNQDSKDCSNLDKPDTSPLSVVVAQPFDGTLVHVMNTTSELEVILGGGQAKPQDILGEDARFVREVCEFVARVRLAPIPTSPAKPLPCVR